MTLNTLLLACALVVVLLPAPADDRMTTRLATCQDSWLDWKDDPALIQKFGGAFQAAFVQKDKEGYFVPRATLTVGGLKVMRAYPESIGMGVGFSVIVAAGFDDARKAVEKEIGKPFKDCETGDGMRTCGLEIAEKRSLTVMAAEKPERKETLIGCYYFYAK